jgi:hypothetical protein
MTIARRRIDIPGQSPAEDRLIAMIAALASELAVMRDRLDTVERLAERAGVLTRPGIDAFVPDPDASAERDAVRRHLIAKTFRPLRDAAARSVGDAA